MKPFQKATIPMEQIEEIAAVLRKSYSEEFVATAISQAMQDTVFVNDQYQVHMSLLTIMGDVPMVHLSIRRLDREAIHDWRDMQEIKNMLVGAECEGVELYPAESRRVDSANQYHIFCFADKEARFPFGFNERFVTGENFMPDLPRAKQRPIMP